MKNIPWMGIFIGIAIAWFGLPLLQSLLSKAKG
jgi:hypothetical protein